MKKEIEACHRQIEFYENQNDYPGMGPTDEQYSEPLGQSSSIEPKPISEMMKEESDLD